LRNTQQHRVSARLRQQWLVSLEDSSENELELAYTISHPIEIPIEALGVILNGTAAGQIAASAKLPVLEPASLEARIAEKVRPAITTLLFRGVRLFSLLSYPYGAHAIS
jgi:hypothetical protein